MKKTLFAPVVCAALAGTVQATVVIDFESDTAGGKPSGWMSADSALVSFSDSMGADLSVYDYGE